MTISTSVVPDVPEGTLDPAAGLNAALNPLRALCQAVVSDVGVASPPGSPFDGECVIIGTGTGDFLGHDDDMARYVSAGAFWQFYPPGTAVSLVFNSNDLTIYAFDPSTAGGWFQFVSSASAIELQVACSDMVTPLGAASGVAYIRAPRAFTISSVRASLAAVSSSGAVQIDINVNGSTVLSTKLTIDSGEFTSITAATSAVVSAPDIDDDDLIQFDIDSAGTDAAGLIVTLLGTRT